MQVKKQQLELDMEKQTDSRLGKYIQGCMLSPCLFNLYVEYIMRNAGLDEEQAGIKVAGRNINNLRYAPPLWWKWRTKEPLDESERREWKSCFKTFTIQKTKIMASDQN